MTKLVRPRMSSSMARWISSSVRVSTFEVASSRMSAGRLARTARAIVTSWRWPWLRFVPSSLMTKSYPPASVWMKWSQRAAFAAASTSASVASGRP